MDHPVGSEVESTAAWLAERGAQGAAVLLLRLARQRDLSLRVLSDERSRSRYPLAWRSARRRARRTGAQFASVSEQLEDFHEKWGEDCRHFNDDYGHVARVNAQLRTDMQQLKIHAERAGWIPDPEQARLWRWRQGWWELSRCRRNPKDGYHDTGWYLWGPTGSGYFGAWAARLKNEATLEADRLITSHLTAIAEARRG